MFHHFNLKNNKENILYTVYTIHNSWICFTYFHVFNKRTNSFWISHTFSHTVCLHCPEWCCNGLSLSNFEKKNSIINKISWKYIESWHRCQSTSNTYIILVDMNSMGCTAVWLNYDISFFVPNVLSVNGIRLWINIIK